MISQGEGCREDVGGGGWQHTRQTLEKSPTSKLYTTWAHILSDRNVFAPRGGGERRGPMPLGLFLLTDDVVLKSKLIQINSTLEGRLLINVEDIVPCLFLELRA